MKINSLWICCLTGISMLAASCQKVIAPEYRSVSDFKVKSVGISSSTVQVNFNYYNPNNFGVKMKNTECDIYVDTAYLGHFIMEDVLSIPSKSDFAIPLTGDVDMKVIYKYALNSRGDKLQVKVTGNTKVGKAGIFVNYPIKYEGLHSIEDFMK